MKNKFHILFIGIILLGSCKEKKASDNFLSNTILKGCKGKSIALILPKDWLKNERHEYMEGFLQTYSYSDNSRVAMLCGHNADLNSNNKLDDKFNRKEIINGITIIYENVLSEQKEVFDQAFDLMKENGINKK
jgi:hypothetical protein